LYRTICESCCHCCHNPPAPIWLTPYTANMGCNLWPLHQWGDAMSLIFYRGTGYDVPNQALNWKLQYTEFDLGASKCPPKVFYYGQNFVKFGLEKKWFWPILKIYIWKKWPNFARFQRKKNANHQIFIISSNK